MALCGLKLRILLKESPTTRRAGGLGFSASGGKKQRHGSALIGAGVENTQSRGKLIRAVSGRLPATHQMVCANFLKINFGLFAAVFTYGAAILEAAPGRWI